MNNFTYNTKNSKNLVKVYDWPLWNMVILIFNSYHKDYLTAYNYTAYNNKSASSYMEIKSIEKGYIELIIYVIQW